MVDIGVGDVLVILQQNTVLGLSIIVAYVLGHFSVDSLFRSKFRSDFSRRLAIFVTGFVILAPSLFMSLVLAKLGEWQNRDFTITYCAFLIILFLVIVVYFGHAFESKALFVTKLKKYLWSFMEIDLLMFVGICIVLGFVLLVYPSYVSRELLGWGYFWAYAGFWLIAIFLPLAFILSFLSESKGNYGKVFKSLMQNKIGARRVLAMGLLLIVLAGLLFADSRVPLFTPKISMTQSEDGYRSPYPPYQIDYLMILSPTSNGAFVPHFLELYNVTVNMASSTIPTPEACVRYDNPANSSYALSRTNVIINEEYFLNGYYMPLNRLLSQSSGLISYPNETYTQEVEQCTPGIVTFHFWKEVSGPSSLQVQSHCVYLDDSKTRIDNITITNPQKLNIYFGAIELRYFVEGQSLQVNATINGRLNTYPLISGGYIIPFPGDLSTHTQYNVQLAYHGFAVACVP